MRKLNGNESVSQLKDKYDFIVVGAGPAGVTFANLAGESNNILIVEKRNHIAGNTYTVNKDGIDLHVYGAHIFHTNDQKVYDYLSMFTEWVDYKHQVVADYEGQIYQLPFNMMTFCQIFGNVTVERAKQRISEEAFNYIESKGGEAFTPQNLEEQAISMVGTTVYDKLIKGYTEKQWGRSCKELPASIIKRLPLRFNFDNTYFNDAKYQGIPKDGFTAMFENMLHWDNIDVLVNVDFLKSRKFFEERLTTNGKIIFCGAIDDLFSYDIGHLEYRSLKFEHSQIASSNHQGTSVINYTHPDVPWTRIIEHKHFNDRGVNTTIVTKEYSQDYEPGNVNKEAYYPIGQKKNNDLYEAYRSRLSNEFPKYVLIGRLAEYKYFDTDKVVRSSIDKSIPIIDEYLKTK